MCRTATGSCIRRRFRNPPPFCVFRNIFLRLNFYMKNGNPSKFIASHVVGLPKSGIREFFAIAANMEDVVSLGIGEPDFVTPWHIRESAIFALEKGKTSYTDNLGLGAACATRYQNMWKKTTRLRMIRRAKYSWESASRRCLTASSGRL